MKKERRGEGAAVERSGRELRQANEQCCLKFHVLSTVDTRTGEACRECILLETFTEVKLCFTTFFYS